MWVVLMVSMSTHCCLAVHHHLLPIIPSPFVIFSSPSSSFCLSSFHPHCCCSLVVHPHLPIIPIPYHSLSLWQFSLSLKLLQICTLLSKVYLFFLQRILHWFLSDKTQCIYVQDDGHWMVKGHFAKAVAKDSKIKWVEKDNKYFLSLLMVNLLWFLTSDIII